MPADHLWQSGQSGNPNGRPKGSRNKRTEELWSRLEARGDRDPADVLSEAASDKNLPIEVQIQAATNLLPYKYSKCGATPPRQFIEEVFVYPHPVPTTVEEANANTAHLNQAYANRTLDLASYSMMLAGQDQHTKHFKAREELPANTDIHVTGGLPWPLPGTNITKPQLNGHDALEILPPAEPEPEPVTPVIPVHSAPEPAQEWDPANHLDEDEGTSP